MREGAAAAILAGALALVAFGCAREPAGATHYGLGRPIDDATLARIDIDVAPDGRGLPVGAGDAAHGAQIFAQRCASCHGTAIKLSVDRWPYATTLFDYIRRAMPPTRSVPLRDDDVYSLVAYELYMNGIIGERDELDATTLKSVAMPGLKLFVDR